MQILASNVYRDGSGVKPKTLGRRQEEQIDDWRDMEWGGAKDTDRGGGKETTVRGN